MKPWFDAVKLERLIEFNVKPSFAGKTYTVNAGKLNLLKIPKAY